METNAVKVVLWGKEVGYLAWDKKREIAVFEYDPLFIDQDLDIAPFTMSIKSMRSIKGLPWTGNRDSLYKGLPTMLADSLPDKWGNSLFNAWLRDNKISIRNTNPVDHLSFIGSRGLGALEYVPAFPLGDNSAFNVDVQRLYMFSKQVLNERENTILDQENSILWKDLIKISSSPGGKRPKAIIALNDTTGEIISGQGVIPDTFQHYILKYDDNTQFPFAKMEFVYSRIATDAGINMMPSQLRAFGNISHFLTQRFDRLGNEKIHTQTLAAVSPLSSSYEDIFATIRALKLPYEDTKQQYLRMVFNVIARNADDHSKNFSFFMNQEGVWRLSPAYDLTYSIDLNAPAYTNKHSFTINGKRDEISLKDLEIVGQNNDIQDYKSLIEKVEDSISNFEKYSKESDVDVKLIDLIKSDFASIRSVK